MRKSFGSFVVMAAVILGSALAANADSQSFQESGPGGQQTLTVNTNLDFWHWDSGYSFTLSGATGSTSGSCSWFSNCVVTAMFTTTVAGVTYYETAVEQGRWGFGGGVFGWTWTQRSFAVPAVPEESSLFELMAVALALVLILPRAAKLRHAAQA